MIPRLELCEKSEGTTAKSCCGLRKELLCNRPPCCCPAEKSRNRVHVTRGDDQEGATKCMTGRDIPDTDVTDTVDAPHSGPVTLVATKHSTVAEHPTACLTLPPGDQVCPWCFSKKDGGTADDDSDDSEDEEAGLMKNEGKQESNEASEEKDSGTADSAPSKAPKAPPPPPPPPLHAPPAPAPRAPKAMSGGPKTDPANAPTAEELQETSEYTDEIGQLSHIIALMIAECVFAYEEPFDIQLESQFAMMFDMELSFSFNSLKEAERQLMSALAEIFSKKESAAFFFSQLDQQMNDATEKFEYKQKSGYGRPDKLRLALEGQYAPKQEKEDCYKMTVEYIDNMRRANNPYRYEVIIYQAGSIAGTSSDIKMMKAKKQ